MSNKILNIFFAIAICVLAVANVQALNTYGNNVNISGLYYQNGININSLISADIIISYNNSMYYGSTSTITYQNTSLSNILNNYFNVSGTTPKKVILRENLGYLNSTVAVPSNTWIEFSSAILNNTVNNGFHTGGDNVIYTGELHVSTDNKSLFSDSVAGTVKYLTYIIIDNGINYPGVFVSYKAKDLEIANFKSDDWLGIVVNLNGPQQLALHDISITMSSTRPSPCCWGSWDIVPIFVSSNIPNRELISWDINNIYIDGTNMGQENSTAIVVNTNPGVLPPQTVNLKNIKVINYSLDNLDFMFYGDNNTNTIDNLYSKNSINSVYICANHTTISNSHFENSGTGINIGDPGCGNDNLHAITIKDSVATNNTVGFHVGRYNANLNDITFDNVIAHDNDYGIMINTSDQFGNWGHNVDNISLINVNLRGNRILPYIFNSNTNMSTYYVQNKPYATTDPIIRGRTSLGGYAITGDGRGIFTAEGQFMNVPYWQLTVTDGIGFANNNGAVYWNTYYDGGWKYVSSGMYGGLLKLDGTGSFIFGTATSTGTAGGTAPIIIAASLDKNGNFTAAGTIKSTNLKDSINYIVSLPTGIQEGEPGVSNSCTIQGVYVRNNAAGSISVTIAKASAGGAYSDIGTITTSSELYTADTTLAGWTTSLEANDYLRYTLNSMSGASSANVRLDCKR